MDIEIKCWKDPSSCGGDAETMRINSQARLSVSSLSECPEDAIIGRDLVDCRQISRFMAEAHKAGANSETLNIKITEVETRDALFEN